jgi:hypothetical protein
MVAPAQIIDGLRLASVARDIYQFVVRTSGEGNRF